MAITQFTKDMAIIKALADLPNATDGLTAAQLKDKFDEGGLALKDYINASIVAAVNAHLIETATGVTKPHGIDTAAAQTYEEGSFTPVLAFGGGSTGITYTTQSGKYRKIGKIVFFEIFIALSSKGSSTGVATIAGLPFASAGTNPTRGGDIGAFTNITKPANTIDICWRLGAGLTFLQLLANIDAGATTGLLNGNFSDTTSIQMQGMYFT